MKLKTLKKTKNFYLWQLKRSGSLTKNEKSKYQVALRSINKIIKEENLSGKKEKSKYFSKIRGY